MLTILSAFVGSATVSVAPVGVSPTGFGSVGLFFTYDTFGETPKVATETVALPSGTPQC
jgi:hypothetical protein